MCSDDPPELDVYEKTKSLLPRSQTVIRGLCARNPWIGTEFTVMAGKEEERSAICNLTDCIYNTTAKKVVYFDISNTTIGKK